MVEIKYLYGINLRKILQDMRKICKKKLCIERIKITLFQRLKLYLEMKS